MTKTTEHKKETIYRAVVNSKEWEDWVEYNESGEGMWDVWETQEADLMSGEHWNAFVEFIKENYD